MAREKSQNEIIENIKKLLATAGDAGATPNEREIAMRMATKLMDKHAISMDQASADTSDPRGKDAADVGTPAWRHSIFGSIGKLYGCVVYTRPSVVNGKRVKEIVVVGRETHRFAIFSMAAWLITSIEKECADTIESGAGRRDSFKKGAASGIAETVVRIMQERERGETVDQPGKGLMVVNAYKAEHAANMEMLGGMKLKPGKAMTMRNRNTFAEGRAYGKSLNLNTQLSGSGQKRIK